MSQTEEIKSSAHTPTVPADAVSAAQRHDAKKWIADALCEYAGTLSPAVAVAFADRANACLRVLGLFD